MPRALADSVEAGLSPVASVLPPPADIVAQNVLRDPTLRSLSALSLAKLLSVASPAAVEGIAAIVNLARNRGQGPLYRSPDLEGAIGPFMSTDTALARFGAHTGPIESNANPRGQVMAGAIGGYGDAWGLAYGQNPNFDNDAGGFPEEYYGDPFGGNEAGLGEAPPTVTPDSPPNPSPNPSPAPLPTPSPQSSFLSDGTLFGLPILAVAAAGVGTWLLLRKKRRGRRR